ncbi:MAG: GtrA family protein [Burkholderiales bacterium]
MVYRPGGRPRGTPSRPFPLDPTPSDPSPGRPAVPPTRGASPPARGPAPKASVPRFLVVGSGCTVVQYTLLVAMIDGLNWLPVLSSAIAYAIAVTLNYELSRRYTFYGRPRSWREYRRFVTGSLATLALNTSLFEAGLRAGLPHYLVAQVIATGAATVASFLIYRYWTFRG